jgi:hypothetical protein
MDEVDEKEMVLRRKSANRNIPGAFFGPALS